jgi:hypothetical protein
MLGCRSGTSAKRRLYPKRVCYHEAAHAAVALSFGRKPDRAVVRRNRTGYVARVLQGRALYTARPVAECAVILFAGVHAEARLTGCDPVRLLHTAGRRDARLAALAFRWLVREGHAPSLAAASRRAHRDAAAAVRRVWPLVERLAAELRVRGRLDGRQLRRLSTPVLRLK